MVTKREGEAQPGPFIIEHTSAQRDLIRAVVAAFSVQGEVVDPNRMILCTDRTAGLPGKLHCTVAPCGCTAAWRNVSGHPRVTQRFTACAVHPMSVDVLLIVRQECRAIYGTEVQS